MRYTLLFLVLAITACSAQTSQQQGRIDTAKLFNPNSHPDHAGARDMNIFKRAIALVQPDLYSISLNAKELSMAKMTKAKEFIVANKEEIRENLFYIVIDSSTDFKRTVSVIDLLKENSITDYKVINYQQYFTPAEPVDISAPTVIQEEVVKKIDESTYLRIRISADSFHVILNNERIVFKDTAELDKFINAHKTEIKDINLRVPDGGKYVDRLTLVIDVLKKHGFYKYSISGSL
jgi:hypothetical protein